MKIFGFEIKKIQKVRKVVFDTKTYSPRIEISLVGDGWEFSDKIDFPPLITSHVNDLSKVATLTNEQIVDILRIFYRDICEFEIM